MASHFHLLLLFLLFSLSHAQISTSSPNSLFLPITKHVSTLQYIAQIHHGTPLSPVNVVVDLGGSNLWLDCSSSAAAAAAAVSLSRVQFSHRSVQCSSAKQSNTLLTCPRCNLFVENSISRITQIGELVEDIISTTTDHRRRRLLFACAPSLLLNGLASGARGMLGLGKSAIGLPTQLAMSFNYNMKFHVCLSSSTGGGAVIFSDQPQVSIFGADISKSLMFTPLMSSNQEYYINVKSLKINGKKLSTQKPIGKTKISTTIPHTKMGSSIYTEFVNAYKQSADSMNISLAAAVAPFGLCFRSKGVDGTNLGPVVPEIEMVLQSEMVKWKIIGRNSMVKVSDEVMCLGFLDGGLKMEDCGMEIGGFQLEDVVLEFDKGKSRMGFSSSLLMEGKSCSDFRLDGMDRETL